MKAFIAALALLVAAPAAQAQIVIQAPGIPGLSRLEPEREYRGPPGEYWRRQREGEREMEWRRREEYRDEARREDWRRDHCVRDYRNQVYCRR